LPTLLIFAGIGVSLAATRPSSWQPNPAVAERFAKRYPQRNYDESRIPPYTLPDAMTLADGTRVMTPAQWQRRREELLELFRREMFGRAPAMPAELTFSVREHDASAMNGAATLKRIVITSREGGREHSFELALFVPNATKRPAAAFLVICNRTRDNIDATRKIKSPFWPAEEIIARGYATAAFFNGDVAPDDKTSFRDGIIKCLEGDVQERPPDAGKAISAWAWAASRALDYLETDNAVDAKRVAVVGHSRGGKTAIWAAAQDTRFAMAVSNQSGACGAKLSRRLYGETIDLTDGVNPHWFCENFRKYHHRESELPFDQHELLALVAPRAVYVSSADEDLSADPRGSFLALCESSPVYALWNHAPIVPGELPPLDTPFVKGPRAYHVRKGVHDLTLYDWQRFMDFADQLWPHGPLPPAAP
jgi:hypothetical protein